MPFLEITQFLQSVSLSLGHLRYFKSLVFYRILSSILSFSSLSNNSIQTARFFVKALQAYRPVYYLSVDFHIVHISQFLLFYVIVHESFPLSNLACFRAC